MEEVFEKLRYLFKYRNSPFFNKEIFVNEKDFLEWLKIPDTDVDTFTNKLLKELFSLTGLEKNELKKVLGTENYYNLLLFFFDVNSCLKNLISKEVTSKNYIQELINRKKKTGLFRNLTKDKMSNILSFFSEIVCSSISMAGITEFIISGDKYKFIHKHDGPFDIILKKDENLYFFDIKRITFDANLENIDNTYIENKLKEYLENVCEKAHGIEKPIFLIIDCSDVAVIEKFVGIDSETGNTKYELGFTGDRILGILKNYINSNINTFNGLKKVAGISLLFWMVGLQKEKQDFTLIFWRMPYTNPHSKFYSDTTIKINNILWNEFKKEHDRIMPNTGALEILGFKKL